MLIPYGHMPLNGQMFEANSVNSLNNSEYQHSLFAGGKTDDLESGSKV